MQAISLEERKSLESKAKLFLQAIGAPENAVPPLVNLVEPLHSELNTKVERFELKEILIKMEKGFELMEKRFEAVDKRFEDMQRYMDKRFEAVDKRFEDMDKRFTVLTWFVALAFLAMPVILTLILRFAS